MKRSKTTIIFLLIFLSIFVFINIIGIVLDCRYISVFAAADGAETFEVRSRLLMEAMDNIGVCTPEEAALVWAKGLKKRSAAVQYSVMSEELKKGYAQKLEKTAPNWVTGLSSPWVESFEISGVETEGKDRIIKLLISTRTSTGPAGDYLAILTVSQEGGFWRIKHITADSALYPYTGLNPR